MISPHSILITGASSGIGAALAEHYAAAGVTLLLLGRDAARLEAVADRCRAKAAVVIAESIDVRDRERMAERIASLDAASPIDLVIANAGVSANGFNETAMQKKSVARMEAASRAADDVFAINVQGVLNTIHPLIPRMVARGSGHIAIMSSLAGICALPSAPAYSASKAAVRFYGDALRGMLKPHGVQVSVICPGWITTPLTQKNTFPMPFMMSAERAASIIACGLRRKKSRIAFPRRLYFPLVMLAALPDFLTDAIFARLPKNG